MSDTGKGFTMSAIQSLVARGGTNIAEGLCERIDPSGLEGVNRPTKQTRPISANFCSDLETSGLFPGTSGKMHFGVLSWSFREFFPLSICCGLQD
jgi:hypothetical protein